MTSGLFEVDRKGLAKLLRSRGLHRMFEELISNALDEKVTYVKVTVEPTGNHMEYRFAVEDDSAEGFQNLDHAYTLFAESYKKNNPLQRGRFNFGEKWVIAICKSASISTTSGTVLFDGDERRRSRTKREAGTLFEGIITATQDEVTKAIDRLHEIIPDEGVEFSVNGLVLSRPKAVATFEATLPTITTNEEGELVRTERKSVVYCYEVAEGQRPTVYEMGIPVVKLDAKGGDPYHYDVRQKVPLSLNRDNVPPRFLKLLRTEVLNNTFHLLTKEQAQSRAVTEALEQAKPEAVITMMTQRYGEKRAIYDPSDIESNNRLMGEGYTIIPPGSFDKATWGHVKETGGAVASGTLRPTPQPYAESGRPVKVIDQLTPGMERLKAFIIMLGKEVCHRSVTVAFVNAPNNRFSMCCGKTGCLDVNVGVLGHKWIDAPPAREECLDILCDEFGHLEEENHLSANYYRLLRRCGARMTMLALERPELFTNFR